MNRISDYFHLAGGRYWPAFLLPALVGTTLPFWLQPPGFYFKPVAAMEFLVAVALVVAGMALLQAGFDHRVATTPSTSRLMGIGIGCLLAAVLIGWHINAHLELNQYVHRGIFIIFGLSALFIGWLYVAPPVRFYRRMGGETILSVGVGMMPVLGAYIIQAGDLTRTVYLASLPLVVAAGLWVWISALIHRPDDERSGATTMVMLFPPRVAGRFGTTLLTAGVYVTVILAVIGRSSLNPLSLVALLSLGLGVNIIRLAWQGYADPEKMEQARRYAAIQFTVVCICLVLSSLATMVVTV